MKKTTVITSGTSGIGKEIVKKLLLKSKNKDDLFIVNYGHNDYQAECLLAELSIEDKNKVILVKADMSTYEGIKIIEDVLKKSERMIDWLILNTGISSYLPFDEYTPELWEHIMRTNVSVPVFLIKALLPYFKDGGSIVCMGSHAGQETYSSSLVYSVSKAAVLFMARSFVKILENKQIRINAIAPGFIETKWQKNRSLESRERIEKKIALHRFGKPEEVANLCCHILENEYLNGSIFDIHGGYNYF